MFLLFSLACFSQEDDYQIIVTTPGYTSVFRYDSTSFAEGVSKDFRIQGNVSIVEDEPRDGARQVWLTIGTRQFRYAVSPTAPVLRLMYDRNRRLFSGVGFNFVDDERARYEPPRFKGKSMGELPVLLEREINKQIEDRTLLSTEPTVFLLEADIDENGIVHKIVELNGSLKQYSKVIIDQFYDQAVRGWEPAKRNGIPYRTLAQIKFELSR